MTRATALREELGAEHIPATARTDEEIVALARQDMDAALRLLMRQHGDRLARFCRGMVGNDSDADDALQDTFFHASQDLLRAERHSSLNNWLFGIAKNRCIDLLRKRKRWGRFFGSEVPDPTDPALGVNERRNIARALEQCLLRLRPELRAEVLQHHQQGFTFPELAQRQGEKEGTLQRRVERAVEKLCECVQRRLEAWL